jgi:hypothetical protein
MEEDAITFHATFGKALTTVDGGWRLQLELSENCGGIVADIAKLKGVLLHVVIMAINE